MATIWITHPKKSKVPAKTLQLLMEYGFDAHAADQENCLTVTNDNSSVGVTAIAAQPSDEKKQTKTTGLLDLIKDRLKGETYMSIVIKGPETSTWNLGNYAATDSRERQAVIEAVSTVVKEALDDDKLGRIYRAVNVEASGKEGSGAKQKKPEKNLEPKAKKNDKGSLNSKFQRFDKLLQVMRKTVNISDTFFECTREERQEIVDELEKLQG
jgi:hypothetical protein